MARTARIGIDVGGTFTDLVLHDSRRRITHTGKHLTTPDAPTRAIAAGLERLLSESDTPMANVSGIVHGTTLATNTLLERTGPTLGLITTMGFRDILEMGRESRFDIEDLHARPSAALVSRRRRIGVGGRMTAHGSEHAPLDEDAVRTAVRKLVEGEGVQTLAVSFLHSYANPEHELRAREVIRELYPELPVTLSAQVAPLIGEYERTVTACANAYVQPVIQAHLRRLEAQLVALGFEGELHIMLSSGGLTTPEHSGEFPIKLLESGPAAGAIAAAFLAERAREDRVIAFDMGGTTAKMGVIDSGELSRAHNFEAARADTFKPGSGLPLRLAVVDMIEIGAGGGSIAAVDELGLLTVGPRSAGSVPGPISYGRGGRAPTVTDADLLAGYLDADSFLGGEMPLATSELEAALHEQLARPLELEVRAAAIGVQDVVTENMAAATRAYLAERGAEAGAYTLMAFGGAGPVHAYALAKRLKMRRIIIPADAGVASAMGFLLAAPMADAAHSCPAPLASADWERITALLEAMEAQARSVVTAAAGPGVAISVRRTADMRYIGQGHEVEVDLPAGPLGPADVEAISDAFSATYRSTFGRTVDGAQPQLVNVRTFVTGPRYEITPTGPSERIDRRVGVPAQARLGSRLVHFPDFGELDAAVYQRRMLPRGTRFRGPAVITEPNTSCGLGPDCVIEVDEDLNLMAEIQPRAGSADGSVLDPP